MGLNNSYRLTARHVLALVACSACSQADGEWQAEAGWEELDEPNGTSEVRAPSGAGVPGGNLTEDKRYLLRDLASGMLDRLEAQAATGDAIDEGAEEPSADPATEAQNGNGEAASELDSRTRDAREAWEEFLSSIHQNPTGTYAIGDMFIGSDEQLLSLFEAQYASGRSKGLVLPGAAWAAPITLSVCWTPDSNATNAEKQRVAALVNSRWAAISNVAFDFGTAPGMRTCAEQACGFFVCPTGNEQIRIYQNSAVARGCSPVGTGHTSMPGQLQCAGEPVYHDYASMYLQTEATVTDEFSDYVTVHEFGHTMGLLHEQDHPNYIIGTCSSGDGTQATTPGESTYGSAYDPISIMNYCHQQLNLPFADDPRLSEISVGDIFSSRSMYAAPDSRVRVRYSSWLPASVQLTVQSTNFNVSATRTPVLLNSGIYRTVGDSYTVAATAGSRLRCYARGRARGVFNEPQVSPPSAFTSNPAISECYDPASLTAATTFVL